MAQEIQLGYSCSGKVIDVGEEVVGYKVGDRVACSGLFAAHILRLFLSQLILLL